MTGEEETVEEDSAPESLIITEFDISVAGIYVEDALSFRNLVFRRDKIHLYQLYQERIVRFMFTSFTLGLLMLAILEEPHSVPLISVPWEVVISVEITCLLTCLFRLFHLKLCLEARYFWRDKKNIVIMAVLLLTFIDIITWLTFKLYKGESVVRVTRVLRPLIIVNFSENRNLRKLIRNIKRTVMDAASVLVLIFLVITIFAMMATKFFDRRSLTDPKGNPYLDNFLDSFWNMYVLMTTANSPDVSLPAYKEESSFILFFAPFSIITTFILMNILLAIVYKHYRIHLIEEVKSDVEIIENNLEKAFKLLSYKNNFISKETWDRSYRRLGCSDNLQKLYWDYLTTDQESDIQFEEGIPQASFLKITDLLSSKVKIVTAKTTWLERKLPRLYNSAASCYLRFAVNHKAFAIFFDVLILLYAILLVTKFSNTVENVFLVVFNIEILLKLYTYGPIEFAQSAWNIYDCTVIWAASIFRIVEDVSSIHSKNQELGGVLLDMVMTLRVLRLLKVLSSVPQLRHIIGTLIRIIPSMRSYAALYLLLCYSFSILGMEIFGGKIVGNDSTICGNSLLSNTDFYREGYCILNFNHIGTSIVVLWTLTLVNQWHVLAEGFTAVTSKATRIYFLSFHVIVVLLVLNILLAFIIEAFMMQIDSDEEKNSDLDKHLESRGVNARKDSEAMHSKWYTRKNSKDLRAAVEEVYVGTTPIADTKLKYKRETSSKSYNQMLLEMFQHDIPSRQASTSTSLATSSLHEALSTPTIRLSYLREEESASTTRDPLENVSLGSLDDIDII